MATKASFTNEEWAMIMESPVLAGMGVSMLDFGLISFAKEFKSLIKAVTDARAQYPNNELIQSLISEFESKTGTEDTTPADGPHKTPDEMLAMLQGVAAVVDAKTPAEAREFKAFLFGVGERVANASGSGFLGFGEKVSDQERAYLARMQTCLGL